MIALDSTFLVDYLRGSADAGSFLEERELTVFHASTIVLFESYRDAARSDNESVKNVASALEWIEPLPFDAGATREAAEIHAELLEEGDPINVADAMIVGVCRHAGARLVTRDNHFDKVADLETVSY